MDDWNSISINQTVSIPEKMQQILDELSILSKHVYLATNSTCLDCYFAYNDYPPFVSTTSSVKNMNLANECPRCGKKGLIHTISWDYPESISKLIIPDSSWFYEIVIGYAIANLDKVRDVYIHKKINSVINGNKIDPYEADVIIVTQNSKLFLAEVTVQSDESNLISEISRKCEYLKKAKIHYDKLMYFTSSVSQTYKDMKVFKARIFSL